LRAYPDLLRFARSAGVLTAAEARTLRRWAAAHPRAARTALAHAAEVREAIAAVLQALVGSKPIPAAPLARVELACREASTARALRPLDGSAEWVWRELRPEPARPAWAAALEAARILTSPEESARVRQCADDECGWFFLDTSRNRTRRWCSMKVCGNRNKVRRFYERTAARRKR
jgi:predicted RNA-binding Zn ribbon-like protein